MRRDREHPRVALHGKKNLQQEELPGCLGSKGIVLLEMGAPKILLSQEERVPS
jgi:hypothetical protein